MDDGMYTSKKGLTQVMLFLYVTDDMVVAHRTAVSESSWLCALGLPTYNYIL